MQELYNALAQRSRRAKCYAKQHGFTLVLDFSQQQSPVLYATESTNITKAVIDAYNVKSGVAPPPAQPASAVPSAPKPTTPRAPAPH